MTTLVFTYLGAWLFMGAYVLRLVVDHRRLIRRIAEIDGEVEATPHEPVRGKRVA
jgi:hypothetical protein